MFFKKKVVLPGEVYFFSKGNNNNPWEKETMVKAYVVDVKEGWVKYTFSCGVQTYSYHEVKYFLQIFNRKLEP